MSVRPIVIGAETQVLRQKAQPVASFDKKLKKLIQNLLDTVMEAEGAGLAAPQVNVSERVFVAKIAGRFLPFVNPEIIWRSGDVVQGEEGCLSLPNIWLMVSRAESIVLRFFDEKGGRQERKFSGFEAREMQHEIDHLDGILIVDYATEDAGAVTSSHQAAL